MKRGVIFSHFGALPSSPLCVLWSTRNEKSMSHCYYFKWRFQRLNVIYVMFVIEGRSRRSEEWLSLNLQSEHCTNTERVCNLHQLTCQRSVFTLFCNPPGGVVLRKHPVVEGKNRKIPKHWILSLILVFAPFFSFWLLISSSFLHPI